MRERVVVEELGEAEDCVHGCAELVSHVGKQTPTDGVCFSRFACGLVEFAELSADDEDRGLDDEEDHRGEHGSEDEDTDSCLADALVDFGAGVLLVERDDGVPGADFSGVLFDAEVSTPPARSCGMSAEGASDRIVDGSEATVGEFPWDVRLTIVFVAPTGVIGMQFCIIFDVVSCFFSTIRKWQMWWQFDRQQLGIDGVPLLLSTR